MAQTALSAVHDAKPISTRGAFLFKVETDLYATFVVMAVKVSRCGDYNEVMR
jgi:hypothetical protein